ncbi:MAG TPA: nuclear transport factor 2 family protein [Pyrinomonadaceae bacterium]|nr:nuclear transport factor 2 family protein [Pyrinomonadaceae bacterium]
MKKTLLLLLILILFISSGLAQRVDTVREVRSLVETERAFSATAVAHGIRDSFLAFLADDGIVFRPGPVNGKQSWGARAPVPGILKWEPIYADVSRAGDMGYDTGPWEFRRGSLQDEPVAFGNFMTVWKKQQDGTWKFAIDLGTSNERPQTPMPTWQLPSNFGSNSWKARSTVNVQTESEAVLDLERQFSQASAIKGASRAYADYIANDVRLLREGKFPSVGREAALAMLAAREHTLVWRPTKADVSRSGDIAYDYGTYEFRETATQSAPTESGNYVHIWKRQRDGRWKLVAEVHNPIPPPSQ